MGRAQWVVVHRLAGLLLAGFLVVAGLTGSVAAFLPELELWLNPEYQVAPRPMPPLDGFELREQALALMPGTVINTVDLSDKAKRAYHAWLEPRYDPITDSDAELQVRGLVLDPYTGAELARKPIDGERYFPLTRRNFGRFLLGLHHSLLLGEPGRILLGIAALVWTLDCLVGCYLTLPPRRPPERRRSTRRWLRAWAERWQLRRAAPAYRLRLDLHRAIGLWAWVLLFMLAWSGVSFNLRGAVYDPVMGLVFNMRDPTLPRVAPEDYRQDPPQTWAVAYDRGRALMTAAAGARGFQVLDEQVLRYEPETSRFLYSVRSTLDIGTRWGRTTVAFDAITGAFIGFQAPTGSGAGNAITVWLQVLHTGMKWRPGLPVLLCLTGVAIPVLTWTGLTLWWRKRRVLRRRQHRRRPAHPGFSA
ncbi:MAG: PepSY domain-containing protein [Gemmatimonadales bacterium]|jgi:uncharacterized iron-regulated membrane protein|nr:PepSY domain-containing protein [Gemmatimonadales bacterium]MBP9199069.1 PepSY domain-containing protein [Gemmatimonadales bacterium]